MMAVLFERNLPSTCSSRMRCAALPVALSCRKSSTSSRRQQHACQAAGSAGDVQQEPSVPFRAPSPATATATATAPSKSAEKAVEGSNGRRRRHSTSTQIIPSSADQSLRYEGVEAAADEVAREVAEKAQQLYPQIARVFNSSSNNDNSQLRGTCVTIQKHQWTATLHASNAQGQNCSLRLHYGPATDNFGGLVAAAAADLARLALYGSQELADARLPSIFGGTLNRQKQNMTLNLPAALYTEYHIDTWRDFLRFRRPGLVGITVVSPSAGSDIGTQRQQQPGTTKEEYEQQQQQQQQQVDDIAPVPTRRRSPSSGQKRSSPNSKVRAAAAAAVCSAAEAVRVFAQERPGMVADASWAFETNPEPPKGSCVDYRAYNHNSPWRARVTLPGVHKWDTAVSKHFKTPLEAAIAADLARLALHGRRQPSSSGCRWNFPPGLYTD